MASERTAWPTWRSTFTDDPRELELSLEDGASTAASHERQP